MPAKKTTQKKSKKTPRSSAKTASRKVKKPASGKPAAKPKKMAMKAAPKKPVSKKAASKSVAPKKAAPKKIAPKPAGGKTPRKKPSTSRRYGSPEALPMKKGPGTGSAGQSGDVQGLSEEESVDTESVEELAEEGQGFEAGIVDGIENAPDPDEAEVTTEEVPEDDVPSEYLDNE